MKQRVSRVSSVLNPKQAYYIADPSDVFYLSGYDGTFGKIIVFSNRAVFITDPRYEGYVKNSPISKDFEICITKDFKQDLKKYINGTSGVFLSRNIPLADYIMVKEIIPAVTFDNMLRRMRMIKDADEIKLIKKAVSINEAAVMDTASRLKEGVTEKDLSAEFEYYVRKAGAEGVSFSTIIAFNENAAVPHHGTSDTKLKPGSMVLMDSGVRYKGYCSDLTRVMAFGIIKNRFKDLQNHYNIVQNAKKTGVEYYKAGNIIKEADKKAREYLAEQGLEQYFTHSLGHSLGIDIHEPPGVSHKEELKFEPGMVLTCEPGLYFTGKYGIRIEDDYLITDNTPQKLGKLSDSLIIV